MENKVDPYVAYLITQLAPELIGHEDLDAYDTTWEKALYLAAEWSEWDSYYEEAAPYHTNGLSTIESILKFAEVY
jgi:hypothetical protein